MDHCYDQKEKNYVTSSELPARKQQKESVRGAHQGSRESWRKRFHKTSQEMRGKQQVFSEEMRTWRIIELNRRQCEDSLRTATIESNAKRRISSSSLSSSQWLDASVKKSGFRTKKTNFLQALSTQGLDWTCAQNNRKLKNVKQERHVVTDGDWNSLPESKTQQAKK
jgi:hypothetical protein